MLKLLETTTNCEHLNAFCNSSKAEADIKAQKSRLKTAIIAIGNPLKEEDSAAIAFMQSVQSILSCEKYCTFTFDNGFAWFKQVLLSHDRIIVIDSMLDSADTPDGVLTAFMTNELLNGSGFAIRASHGLSWIDEIKMVDEECRGIPIFLGIDGLKYQACNEMERAKLFDKAMTVLESILGDGSSIGGNSNA